VPGTPDTWISVELPPRGVGRRVTMELTLVCVLNMVLVQTLVIVVFVRYFLVLVMLLFLKVQVLVCGSAVGYTLVNSETTSSTQVLVTGA
jgi:hypothetical protein